jgi:2'-phosphotransferase
MANVSVQNAAEAPANELQGMNLNEPAAPAAQNGGTRGGKGGKSGRGGGSGGSRGGRDQESPETQLSKALSYILRHGAAKEGLKIRPNGYIELEKVLARPKISKIAFPPREGESGSTSASSRSPDLQDVLDCVESNAKKRFELSSDEEDGKQLIRAVQGHSIKEVVDLSHEPLTLENLQEKLPKLSPPTQETQTGEESGKHYPEYALLHGTDPAAWDAIRASGGLLTMNRNHIHLATGKPGESGVISGMRNSSKVLIFIDVRKALQDGMQFGVASNGAVLTAGLPNQKDQEKVEGGAQAKDAAQPKQGKGGRKGTGKDAAAASTGILPLSYVARVEDNKGNILWTP